MWKCPRCETINESDICVICGEARPIHRQEIELKQEEKPKAKSEPPKVAAVKPAKKSHVALKIVLILCAVAILTVSALLAGLEYMRAQARNSLDVMNYDRAIRYASKIAFYRDAGSILEEAKYKKAKDLIYNGEYEAAVELLGTIFDYKDAATLQKYAMAEDKYSKNQFIDAYYEFCGISDYEGVPEILETLKAVIYNEGVYLYNCRDYSEARRYFEVLQYENYEDTNYYLRMIDRKG